jgi:hypothetical protein
VLPLLAERSNVYALDSAPNAGAATRDGVDQVVVTLQDVSWSTDEWRHFAWGMAREHFVLTYSTEGVKVYTRLSSA